MRHLFLAILFLPLGVHRADDMPRYRLSFSPGKPPEGFTAVAPKVPYDSKTGYGFEASSGDVSFFSVKVPEGNWLVTLSLGDADGASETTVKAETRRLMIENVATEKGKFETRSFVVNVRTPALKAGGEVRLKDRERKSEWWTWDDKLTLEFNGKAPRVATLEVRKADVPTLFICGDSTVCDQPGEPYASWGQMLPRFLKADIAVANYAQSGESLRSSASAKRLDKVLECLKTNDWVLIQFGHNDMKAYDEAAYKKELARWVDAILAKKGKPIPVTPMHRRRFKGDAIENTHKAFPDAVRDLAKEKGLTIVDLHAVSKPLYESFGPAKSEILFAPKDGTHHNNYGAYLLARCVLEGLRADKDLAKHIADGMPAFDPAKPDPPGKFTLPASPGRAEKPDGK